MSVVLSIIAAIVVFCLLILSHELGHFSMAKLVGIYVYDFSLGMGPKLLAFKGKETQYTLRLFPIGGHCLMMGEDEASDDERAFNKKKVWQRILVIVGGPAMNFVAAALIFICLFMVAGFPFASSEIGEVLEGKAAEQAGILSGDVIVEINGQAIKTWNDILPTVEADLLNITLDRNGEIISYLVQPNYDEESGRWMIGILASENPVYIRLNIFKAIGWGCKETFLFTKALILGLTGMATGSVQVTKDDVGGPVMIISMIVQFANSGLYQLLLFAAFLCMNLAVINLLPIPALDGSRIIFLLVEGLRGKPIKPEREGMVHFVGLMLLFALMIFLTYNDILRLINK